MGSIALNAKYRQKACNVSVLVLQPYMLVSLESTFNFSMTRQHRWYNKDNTYQDREISIKSYLNACSKDFLNEWIHFHLFK